MCERLHEHSQTPRVLVHLALLGQKRDGAVRQRCQKGRIYALELGISICDHCELHERQLVNIVDELARQGPHKIGVALPSSKQGIENHREVPGADRVADLPRSLRQLPPKCLVLDAVCLGGGRHLCQIGGTNEAGVTAALNAHACEGALRVTPFAPLGVLVDAPLVPVPRMVILLPWCDEELRQDWSKGMQGSAESQWRRQIDRPVRLTPI
mmetsp:Transcript_13673/g.36833  ORF Transcript_13673/g.36833 Transcript_13673/m.36833 type:complete len:211 (-) Transcript_13673:111-743(-)